MLTQHYWVVAAAILLGILLIALMAFWLWNSWSNEAIRLEEEVAAQFNMAVDELYEYWANSATIEQPYNTWLRAQRGPISYPQEIE